MRLLANRAGHSGPEQVQNGRRGGYARGFPNDQAGKPVAARSRQPVFPAHDAKIRRYPNVVNYAG